MKLPPWRVAFAQTTLLLTSALGQTAAPPVETRVWAHSSGKPIEASLRGIEGDKFILQARDGRVASLPSAQFSNGDREYVRATIHSRVLDTLSRPGEASAARSGWRGPITVEASFCAVAVVQNAVANGRATFQSKHFTFTVPAGLDAKAQQDIAEFFQVTREIHRVAPWGLLGEPAGKDRFGVEIFASNEDFIQAGGREESMADYDAKARVLRCTYDSLGIVQVGDGWVRSEHPQSGRVASISLNQMLLHDLIGAMPNSLLQGLTRCIAEIPVVGPTAWPHLPPAAGSERLEEMGAAAAEGLKSMLSIPTDTEPSQPVSAARNALLTVYAIHYWARLDGNGTAPHLTTFLQEAQKDGLKWQTYNADLKSYRVEWEKFKTSPGVIDLGEGRVRYPEGMVPPKSPTPPQNVESMNEVPYFHISKLTSGKPPEEIASEILSHLKKEGF